MLLRKLSPDCFLLQETMLGNYCAYPPGGYNIVNSTVTGNRVPGDGLSMLIKRGIPCSKVNINTQLQVMAYRVGIWGGVTLCSIYVSPRENIQVDQLNDLVRQLPVPFMLTGDFNAKHQRWGNDVDNVSGHNVLEFLLESNACLLNSGSMTHFHSQTGSYSAIDLTICSPELQTKVDWSVHDDLCGSDHYAIIIKEMIPEAIQRPPQFCFHKANWEEFYNSTYVLNIPNFLADHSIDDIVDKFNNFIGTAAEATIPKSTGMMYRKRLPWWTQQCADSCAARKRALRRYQRSNLLADKIAYHRARAVTKQMLKEARRTSWKGYVNTLTVDTPMSKIWSRIGKMKGIYKEQSTPHIMGENGVAIVEKREIANILARHYAEVSSSGAYSEDFMRIKRREEAKLLCFSDRGEQHQYNSAFTILELQMAIRSCRNTAPGEDEIYYQMLKHCHPTCLQLMLAIFNKVFQERIYPVQWRMGITLSFLKPGKPSGHTDSYRPISLTSNIGKLLEKMVNVRLTYYMEGHHYFPAHQYGFRKMHSTTDALIRVTTDITNAFRSKHSVIAIFFDLKKAYDTTWRHGILRQMHHVGIRGHLAFYIRNFLETRHFKTRVGNTMSDVHIQEEGVPQGSVLSCTLFSIAINPILENLPDGIKGSLYVDDFMIYVQGRCVPAMERRLQIAINRVSEWTSKNGFTFSAPKTVCIHFSRQRGMRPEPSLYLQGHRIPCRDTTRFLGLTLDYKMNWKPHVEHLRTKTTKSLDILKVISHSDWGADRETMLRLYRAIIRAKLDYGCVIYGSATTSTLSKLNPVHHAALRLCTGAFRTSPVPSLYSDAGEMSLQHRRHQLHLQFYVRSMQPHHGTTRGLLQQTDDEHEDAPRQMRTFNEEANSLMQRLNLEYPQIQKYKFSSCPVWQLNPIAFCEGGHYPPKRDTSTGIMKALFLEHMNETHQHEIHIYTDGSKTDSQVGCAAVAENVVIRRRLHQLSSNFTAETYAIQMALEEILARESRLYVVFTDSKSAIDSIKHINSTHPIISNIIKLLIRVASQEKTVQLCWVPSHVMIEGNEKADTEARAAAASEDPLALRRVPYRDYHGVIKRAVWQEWDQEWRDVRNNKLRNIKPIASPWSSSNSTNRLHSKILTRLRIGHTRLTHGHLLEGTNGPYCEDCILPLTVKHIIAECPSYDEGRRHFFPATTNMTYNERMTEILAEKNNTPFNADSVIMFLQFYNLLNHL